MVTGVYGSGLMVKQTVLWGQEMVGMEGRLVGIKRITKLGLRREN